MKYFFIGKELHKVLQVNRPADLVYTWNYPKAARITYMWSEIKRTHQPAFRDKQVAQLLNRSTETIKQYHQKGLIKEPYRVYDIETGLRTRSHTHFWHPEEILELHELMCYPTPLRGTKYGRAGEKLPTRAEVVAMINQGTATTYYVKDKDGNLIPTWASKQ